MEEEEKCEDGLGAARERESKSGKSMCPCGVGCVPVPAVVRGVYFGRPRWGRAALHCHLPPLPSMVEPWQNGPQGWPGADRHGARRAAASEQSAGPERHLGRARAAWPSSPAEKKKTGSYPRISLSCPPCPWAVFAVNSKNSLWIRVLDETVHGVVAGFAVGERERRGGNGKGVGGSERKIGPSFARPRAKNQRESTPRCYDPGHGRPCRPPHAGLNGRLLV